ncbi:hypothetical protein ACSLVQ_28495, partial [Klebsiella pneumoniae]|uniref:hypothetical protein n=1 Tax=Klebsiella pneumoniae TaxID=573 RepID=UPI003EE336AC
LRINTDRDGKEYRFHARLDRNPDGDISMYYGGLQWRPYGQSTFYVDEEIHWRDLEMPEHKDKDMGHRLLEVLAIMYGYKLKKEVA